MSLPEDSLPEEGQGSEFEPIQGDSFLAEGLAAWGRAASDVEGSDPSAEGVRARPEFRERMRQQFLHGSFEGQAAEAQGVPSAKPAEVDELRVEAGLARALDAFDTPPARADFKRDFREAWLATAAEERRIAELEALLLPALRAFGESRARKEFKSDLQRTFQGSDAAAEGGAGLEVRREAGSRRARQGVQRLAGQRKSATRTRPATGRRDRAQTAAARSAGQVHLLRRPTTWGAALLAAAAALLLYPRLFPAQGPASGLQPEGPGSVVDGKGSSPEAARQGAGGQEVLQPGGETRLAGFYDSEWRIDPETYVDGALFLNGQPLASPVLDRTALAALRAGGGRLAHQAQAEGDLRLRYGDYFVVEMDPGSEVALPAIAQLAEGEQMILSGTAGHFRIATSPRFKQEGANLAFVTDHLRVDCVGTVFGVDIIPQGTCVCCTEGLVQVESTCKQNCPELAEGETVIICPRGRGMPGHMKHGHPHRAKLERLEKLVVDGYWH